MSFNRRRTANLSNTTLNMSNGWESASRSLRQVTSSLHIVTLVICKSLSCPCSHVGHLNLKNQLVPASDILRNPHRTPGLLVLGCTSNLRTDLRTRRLLRRGQEPHVRWQRTPDAVLYTVQGSGRPSGLCLCGGLCGFWWVFARCATINIYFIYV